MAEVNLVHQLFISKRIQGVLHIYITRLKVPRQNFSEIDDEFVTILEIKEFVLLIIFTADFYVRTLGGLTLN